MDKRFSRRVTIIFLGIMAILVLVFILDTWNNQKVIPNEAWVIFAGLLGAMGVTLPSPFDH